MTSASGDDTRNPPIVDQQSALLSQAYWRKACEADGIDRIRLADEAQTFGLRARFWGM